eukprot:TRINITY_DN29336_c0_g1_i1.p1 TRINITY_DN29336_c0_g1~~TRINITY_DN29336_c0_g1_i1.p1  ORF type:complete len:466 (-),score=66.65 TRINITY_DN29336_c0_g1_i1:120-1517(-)
MASSWKAKARDLANALVFFSKRRISINFCESLLSESKELDCLGYLKKLERAKENLVVGNSRNFLSNCGISVAVGGRNTIHHSFGSSAFQNAIQTKRFYYVYKRRSDLEHFRGRGHRRYVDNPQKYVMMIILGSGLVVIVYLSNRETVPYSHRKHFILVSKEMERQLGESQFEQLKKAFRGKILPANHPYSLRVRLIARDIIEALERATKSEQSWSDLSYSDATTAKSPYDHPSGVVRWPGEDNEEFKMDQDQWHRKDEVLNEVWVEKSRKSGKKRGDKPSFDHLDGIKWEILVIHDPMVNAFCLPGGKIMVFTGLLEKFPSDAEIATVISHEVGHAVARHAAEGMTSTLWFTIIQLLILQVIYMPDVINAMSTLILRLPFSRRMEVEADYIGLLLMASAGYNPLVAPSVYEKLGKLSGDSVLKNYLSTHPSGKKRAELLKQAKVMQEAVGIYQERIAGQKTLGFL